MHFILCWSTVTLSPTNPMYSFIPPRALRMRLQSEIDTGSLPPGGKLYKNGAQFTVIVLPFGWSQPEVAGHAEWRPCSWFRSYSSSRTSPCCPSLPPPLDRQTTANFMLRFTLSLLLCLPFSCSLVLSPSFFAIHLFYSFFLFANRCKLTRFSLCSLLPLQRRLLRLLGARIDVQ